MTLHLLIIFFSVITIEIIYFLGFFQKLNISITLIKKISQIILSKVKSDNHKEKEVVNYSTKLILNSFKIIGILIVIIFIFFLINYFYNFFYDYFLSINGIAETTIIIVVYLFLRKLIYAKL